MTTIFDTDWFVGVVTEAELVKGVRSKVVLVGELRLCVERDGENVAGLEVPPPLLLPPPPPPPEDAVVEAAAEDAKFDVLKDVLARDLGDASS